MKKMDFMKFIMSIVWLLQVVAEGMSAVVIWRLDILPENLFIALCIFYVVMLCITLTLMVLRVHESRKAIGNIRRVIAVIMAIVMAGAGFILTSVASLLDDTMSSVTAPTVAGATVGVYVLAEDSAESISDAKEYNFAVTDSFDADNLQKMVDEIQSEISSVITTVNYESVFDMVDALYSGEVDAMILNESYVDIFEDVEGYEYFEDETKLIFEYTFRTQVAESNNVGEEAVVEDPVDVTVDPFIIYLSGSDTRSDVLKTSRSDVNIIAAVNPSTREILLVNTPRDYYVPISLSPSGTRDKLTHCGIYGIQCSIDTLSALYDETINYYAQINFTGMETLVDAIGGITVVSDTEFTTLHGNYHIEKGSNNLNGDQAVGFARERYALAGGDNDRGKNQMKILTAIIEKMSVSTLASKYADILKSIEGMFVTDMSSDELSNLVKMQISDSRSWNVHSFAVTGTGASEYTYSMPNRKAYVMYPNDADVQYAADLIDRVMEGDILSEEDLVTK